MIKGKTIFISHNWSDVSVCQQSKSLAIALSETNNVVFLDARSNQRENLKINNRLEVLHWPGKRPTGIKDFLFAIKLMQRHKPDIIVVNFAALDIMLFVSWMLGVKTRVCYYHTMVSQHIADRGGLSLRQKFNIWRKSQAFSKATHILAVSTAAAKDLLKYYYGIDKKRVFVFPNALNGAEVINKYDSSGIGFIGRLDRSKGVDILIRSFAKLAKEYPSLRLEIAGKGEMEKELKELSEIAGIAEMVNWRGAISYEEVTTFISGVMFLVVPSRIDNLPTVVLEAFSTATPVVGARTGGIPDMIEDNVNGKLFIREDEEDLYLKMKELCENDVLRQKLGERAKKTFEEHYCINTLPQRFENLLNNTVN